MNLDSVDEIKLLDKSNVGGSIDSLPDQCLHAWDEASKVQIPEEYKTFDNVVMTGMGGSGLGARVIESVFGKELVKPLVRINDYGLPNFVSEKSLVICSSYSGNTEETLSGAQDAIAKRAKWLAIGGGGKLIETAKENSIPYYQIVPTYNPSNQPRMAIGYSVVGQLVLASKVGLINIQKQDIEVVVEVMRTTQNRKQEAKQLAQKMIDRNIFFVSAEHLTGATHTINNQLNENAKVFSADYVLPELNHHLMEGLKNPTKNNQNLFLFFAESDLYSERLQKRMTITKDVVAKNNIEAYAFKLTSTTKLAQAFELIQFGAYVDYYLALLYGVDPAPIPWVDYFKDQLAK